MAECERKKVNVPRAKLRHRTATKKETRCKGGWEARKVLIDEQPAPPILDSSPVLSPFSALMRDYETKQRTSVGSTNASLSSTCATDTKSMYGSVLFPAINTSNGSMLSCTVHDSINSQSLSDKENSYCISGLDSQLDTDDERDETKIKEASDNSIIVIISSEEDLSDSDSSSVILIEESDGGESEVDAGIGDPHECGSLDNMEDALISLVAHSRDQTSPYTTDSLSKKLLYTSLEEIDRHGAESECTTTDTHGDSSKGLSPVLETASDLVENEDDVAATGSIPMKQSLLRITPLNISKTKERCLENSASMNKEIVDKLSEAANKLDESQDSGHQKESMPKPHQVLVPGKKDSAGQVFAGGSNCPDIQSPLIEYLTPSKRQSLSVKDKLLALVNQRSYIDMDSFFTPVMRKTIQKLGEGVFGEVFNCFDPSGDSMAVKIMPIEGLQLVNDEKQKTFAEILPEMVISKELSDLGLDENNKHYTRNFVQLKKLGIVEGKYPSYLINAWDLWDEEEQSENERPSLFKDHQLYAVFAFENAGRALDSFVFHSTREARSVLAQVAGTLAVGETALQFEHRDMHRGNILVQRVKEKEAVFVINSRRYTVPTEGVRATIIDYTLSRVSKGNCVSYNDLNNLPWLFEGRAGLQHETYLHMRNCTKNVWSTFAPKTNAYWLHYMVNKMALKSKVKHVTRKQIASSLKPFLKLFPLYDSATSAFVDIFSNAVTDEHVVGHHGGPRRRNM